MTRRRPRPHLFTQPVRDALNAIAIFIALAVVLWVLNAFGVNP